MLVIIIIKDNCTNKWESLWHSYVPLCIGHTHFQSLPTFWTPPQFPILPSPQPCSLPLPSPHPVLFSHIRGNILYIPLCVFKFDLTCWLLVHLIYEFNLLYLFFFCKWQDFIFLWLNNDLLCTLFHIFRALEYLGGCQLCWFNILVTVTIGAIINLCLWVCTLHLDLISFDFMLRTVISGCYTTHIFSFYVEPLYQFP